MKRTRLSRLVAWRLRVRYKQRRRLVCFIAGRNLEFEFRVLWSSNTLDEGVKHSRTSNWANSFNHQPTGVHRKLPGTPVG